MKRAGGDATGRDGQGRVIEKEGEVNPNSEVGLSTRLPV